MLEMTKEEYREFNPNYAKYEKDYGVDMYAFRSGCVQTDLELLLEQIKSHSV